MESIFVAKKFYLNYYVIKRFKNFKEIVIYFAGFCLTIVSKSGKIQTVIFLLQDVKTLIRTKSATL